MAFTFLLCSCLLDMKIPLDWLNRNEKEQVTKTHLASLKQQLYVPHGVTFLQESESVDYPNSFSFDFYLSDCFGGAITIVYGTNQSRAEIRQAYAQALSAANWALGPGYKLNESYAVYSKGNEDQLIIDTVEPDVTPTGQYFNVIYSVRLDYQAPSHFDCRGG